MNILITSAGRRVSLIRGFQKEIKQVFPNARVYASDSNPLMSAGCQIADAYFKVPTLEDSSYVETLINICKENSITLVIPTIDTELLLLSSKIKIFEDSDINVLISSFDFVKKCRNKRVIHDFFKSRGINTAREFNKDNYQLPLFIKPIDGSRSINTFVIKSEDDFTSDHFSDDKFMFLEYIDYKMYDEYTCDLYYDKYNHLKCVVPRKRITVREGEVYKAVTKKNILVDYIIDKMSFIDGAVGCITAQFFLHKSDNEKIYGIEINPRFGGGFPLSCLAGANFQKWIIEEYLLGKTIDDKFNTWETDLLMIRYDDEVLVHGYKS